MEIGTIVERDIDSGRVTTPRQYADSPAYPVVSRDLPGRARPKIGDRWYGDHTLEVIAVEDREPDAFGREVWHVTFRVVDPAR